MHDTIVVTALHNDILLPTKTQDAYFEKYMQPVRGDYFFSDKDDDVLNTQELISF